MAGSTTIRFSIPTQDLPAFTLFHPDSESARQWTRSLPVANHRAVIERVSAVLTELNRAPLPPKVRFDILEVLRPHIDSALPGLSRRFLRQPLVMPEQPRQLAALSNQLYALISTAYTIVAIETIRAPDAIETIRAPDAIGDTNPARLACESIHRALVYAGQRVLQSLQLYTPLAMRGWQVLHQLYSLAEHQQLADLPVPNPQPGAATIRGTYLQGVLLGCCKPNQLRQSDLAAVYRALRQLSSLVDFTPPPAGNGLYLVDLDSDQPPLYAALHEPPDDSHCRYLDTTQLVAHLRRLRVPGESGLVPEQVEGLSAGLLDHLIETLGMMMLRNFQRSPSTSELEVCLGFSAAHFHVAGGRTFARVLHHRGISSDAHDHDAQPGNPFLRADVHHDQWQQADLERSFMRAGAAQTDAGWQDPRYAIELDTRTRELLLTGEINEAQAAEDYPVRFAPLADISPGGYCIEWGEALPVDIGVGDIACIREPHSEQWSIASLRWLHRLESSRTLIGLELVSPGARACGARILQRGGAEHTSPQRALLLPEIRLVGLPPTLLTPATGFREGQRIALLHSDGAFTVELLRQVAATAGYRQFEYRAVKTLGDVLARELGGQRPPFDSVWGDI